MQKVFNLVNRYIILTTPLILFSFISNIYMIISVASGKLVIMLTSILLFILMTAAFIAGWFNMIKVAVENPDKEDVNSLMKDFLSGVGEYILPSLGAFLVIMLFSILFLVITYFIGMQSIGEPGITAEALANAMKNAETLKIFLTSLSQEQLIKLNLWNILILSSLCLSSFLMLLYLPTIFFKEKNPLKAFFISIKDLFSRYFAKNIGIFLLILLANSILSILTTISTSFAAMYFIFTLINFYFITVVGVGVFYYYYQTFIKPQLGQNIDIKI